MESHAPGAPTPNTGLLGDFVHEIPSGEVAIPSWFGGPDAEYHSVRGAPGSMNGLLSPRSSQDPERPRSTRGFPVSFVNVIPSEDVAPPIRVVAPSQPA